MELNLQERLVLGNLLPEQGSFITLKTIEEIREVLYPSPEEVEKFEIKQDEERISWNPEGAKPTEIKLKEEHIKYLMELLSELDKSEKATPIHFHLYNRLENN
jgi:lipoate-protein ligase A